METELSCVVEGAIGLFCGVRGYTPELGALPIFPPYTIHGLGEWFAKMLAVVSSCRASARRSCAPRLRVC